MTNRKRPPAGYSRSGGRGSKYTPYQIRRRRAIVSVLAVFFIFILLIVGVWQGGKAIASMNSVAQLTVEASSYTVLDALPSQSEVVAIMEEEARQVENAIFEPQESYPLDMIIQTPYFVVYDVQGKRVLYAKNAYEKCYPASTTKILTAAVMMAYTDEDQTFTAGDELDLVEPGSSLAYLNKGSVLDREMMLDAIMLPSGNDASYCAAATVGRIIADNEELTPEEAVNVFINKMNETAAEAGCTGSNFTCPDGFHDDNHYTTAMDLLRITLYSEQFKEIAESGSKPFRDCTFLSGEEIWWTNSNKLIQEDSEYYYMYATGLKTGMTEHSGQCVVATAERFGHEVIIVCLGSENAAVRWNETTAMFDAAFAYIKNNDN
ncbi:MAG: D-alanyl-D-alanine carboxypeptidase family protein [Huintestinicola sp.]